MTRKMPTTVELQVNVHEEGGAYWAEVPSRPGLFASGTTMDELLEALGEAWALYSSDDDQTPAKSSPVTTQSLQVVVSA
jgi:predicted RNase H-like HicB family nuclease